MNELFRRVDYYQEKEDNKDQIILPLKQLVRFMQNVKILNEGLREIMKSEVVVVVRKLKHHDQTIETTTNNKELRIPIISEDQTKIMIKYHDEPMTEHLKVNKIIVGIKPYY